MTDLVISIINYKTGNLTSNCIRSILNKKWKINYKIWLVDNAYIKPMQAITQSPTAMTTIKGLGYTAKVIKVGWGAAKPVGVKLIKIGLGLGYLGVYRPIRDTWHHFTKPATFELGPEEPKTTSKQNTGEQL